MEQSKYKELIDLWMPAFVLQFEEEAQQKGYLQDRILDKEYSVTGEWASLTEDNSNVMAYVVDMDSPFPRIAQGAATVTKGEIPKIASELYFSEKDLTNLNTLIALGLDRNQNQILQKLFKPLKACYLSQKERLEYMLKQALSTGAAYADTTNNTGAGIAVDFGFKAENKFNASVVWGQAGATPLKDLTDTVVAKAQADGVKVTKAYMQQDVFNFIANDDQAKALVYPDVNSVQMQFATPLDRLNVALLAQFGFVIEIVEGKSNLIVNGKKVVLDGWKQGMISFVTEEKVGALVWADLAENLDRVEGINYQEAEGFILLRKYKTVTPNYAEYDSSQSRSLCVLKNNIYLFDTTATA